MKPALTGLITLSVLALVIVCAVYYSGLYLSKNSSSLQQGFEDVIGKTNERGTFTLYYADWCPHCKTIKPVFKNFMGDGTLNINGKTVAVKMVEEKKIQKGVDPEIQGYPTLLYSDSAGKVVEFNGPRTPDGFMQFLRQKVLA